MQNREFRERITFEKPSQSQKPNGEVKKSWSKIDNSATVWAKATPGSVGEDYTADNKAASKNYKFTIRHRTDIDESLRIDWDNRYWDIRSVDPYYSEGQNKLIRIEADFMENKQYD